ncbi:MAG: hypothetical protein A4E71_01508 [Smithella sp. PtaU1.Bin162]|nr:MAG: hypothetical protein A4E71_01508 [Smithella sp. PtaU1.Bin162]
MVCDPVSSAKPFTPVILFYITVYYFRMVISKFIF